MPAPAPATSTQAELPRGDGDVCTSAAYGATSTLNTLVFPRELAELEETVGAVAAAGVDAVIVQDLGLVRLIRAITPDLEIHASTQMSITSSAGVSRSPASWAAAASSWRASCRWPRSVAIRRARSTSPSRSSFTGALRGLLGSMPDQRGLGGRSANRGECAQACRMPYQIVCDGELVDLDNVQYLLSPQDLAAYDLVPQLIELGVASLKIEGRLKSPEYVANITRHYRMAIDAAWARPPGRVLTARHRGDAALILARFLPRLPGRHQPQGPGRGDYSKKRGLLWAWSNRSPARASVDRRWPPVKPGDGLVFDGDESTGRRRAGRPGLRGGAAGCGRIAAATTAASRGRAPLRPRSRSPWTQLEIGQRVWKTDDPELTRRLRRSFEGPPAPQG